MYKTPQGGFSVWSDKAENLKSQYGNTSYFVWCQKEADRVLKMGRKLYIWTRGDLCCLHKKPQVLDGE
jgi:hypothetical protein